MGTTADIARPPPLHNSEVVRPLPLFLGIRKLEFKVPNHSGNKLGDLEVSKIATGALVVSRSPLSR